MPHSPPPSAEPDPTLEFQQPLQTAIAGLQWLSESDFPFAVLPFADREWQAQTPAQFTPASLLALTDHPETTPIVRLDFDDFFAQVTQPQTWHGEAEQAIVQRYQALVAWFKQQLHDLQVYRLGEIHVDYYILGWADSGTLVGITTQAIET